LGGDWTVSGESPPEAEDARRSPLRTAAKTRPEGTGSIVFRPRLSSRVLLPGGFLLWTDERFWKEWDSSRMLAIVRDRHLQTFESRGNGVEVLARGRGHFLISNFPAGPPRDHGLLTSPVLYAPENGDSTVPLSRIPSCALDRALRESGGESLVWGIQEKVGGRIVYELVTGGRQPRAYEVSPEGDLIYVEEELPPHRLPQPVIAGISRAYPKVEIAYATREYRRTSGPAELYEVYLRLGPEIREIEFEPSGQVYAAEKRVF
jgi:hypothetical protein